MGDQSYALGYTDKHRLASIHIPQSRYLNYSTSRLDIDLFLIRKVDEHVRIKAEGVSDLPIMQTFVAKTHIFNFREAVTI